MACEVRGHSVGGFCHGFLSFFPVGGTNLTMGFVVDPCVQHANRFIDVAPDGEEVDELVTDNAFFVNQEQPSVRHEIAMGNEVALFVVIVVASKNIVVGRDGLVQIGHQWVGHALETAILLGHVEVGSVGFLCVCGDADHSTVAGFKFSELLLECMDLSGTHIGEVTRVEEQDDVFVSEVLVQGKVLDNLASVDNSSFAEIWGLAADKYGHGSGVVLGL